MKRFALVFAFTLLSLPASAQTAVDSRTPSAPADSIFAHSGQGGRWIGEFFPYKTPNIDGIHSALGKMLEIYNTGILVLAGILALWTIISFIAETAHHGSVGGKRSMSVFSSMRLVIAIGLLVPLAGGYNSAQVIALKLADSGSGFANSVWRRFVPMGTSYNFSHAAFASGNVDAFMQQALVDESCLAAIGLTAQSGEPTGSIGIQAFYPDPAHPAHQIEGDEIALPANGGGSGDDMVVNNALQTDAAMRQSKPQWLRVHYNRNPGDDFCGSLDVPVPTVPTGTPLAPEDQAAFLSAYLKVRPSLTTYATKVATAIDTAVKTRTSSKTAPKVLDTPSDSSDFAQDVADAAASGQVLPSEGASSTGTESPATAAPGSKAGPNSSHPPAVSQIEVPQMDLPARAWDSLLDKFDRQLNTVTDQLQTSYIGTELRRDYSEGSDADWIWAGSLFFKLTKLSHDDLKLRFNNVSGDLPNPDILPAEMRSDGVLASCPDLRADVFLPDFHCRPEGKETTLVIKTTYSILHNMEAQRGADVLPAVDSGPGSNRRQNPLAGNLLGLARLDSVVESLGHGANNTDEPAQDGKADPSDSRFESMFDAVNVGNALFLSSSALFRESALAGQEEGGGTHSLILASFAALILVPAFFLGVFLPLFPALRFFTGIATWLVTIFEALVALPLVALVQLRSDGEGLLSHGRQGWFMLLQMLLRPVLMIIGLMAAVMIFEALYGVVTWAIWSALLGTGDDPGQFGGGIEGMLEVLGYLFFWTFLVYLAANISFNAITVIPDRILLWIGAAGGASMALPGSSSQAIPSAGSVEVIGNRPAPQGLPPVSAANLIGGAASPAGRSGAAGEMNLIGGGIGTTAAAASAAAAAGPFITYNRANADQFPRSVETHVPDTAPQIGTSNQPTTSTPKTDAQGRPFTSGRDTKDFIPPVQGDVKN